MTEINAKVDHIFTQWNKSDSPGCALAVIKDGEILYKRGYGMSNLEHEVPIKPETVFDIGSTSKQFTALSILLLHRWGKLDLDDPIQKFVPEIPEYEDKVTLRQLVHHTSGLRDYLVLMVLANMSVYNDHPEQDVVDLIARQKELNFKPGSEFLYSNSAYFLMAEIVERVSGKNLREFADEHIFKPLNMLNTHFHNDFRMIVKNRASGYAPKEDGSFEIDMGIFDVLGDGAVYSTVEDLYLWDQNFYNNILDDKADDLIEQMQQVGIFNDGKEQDYAFGLFIKEYKGLKTVHHGGSWYGYRAQLLRFPEQKFSVICLANLGTISPENLAYQVADVYLADLLKDENEKTDTESEDQSENKSIELSLENLQQLCGNYENKETQTRVEVSISEGQLQIEIMGRKILFQPVSENEFQSCDSSYNVKLEIKKDLEQLSFDVNNGHLKDTLQKLDDFSLSEEGLSEYAGKYYSEELDIIYTLTPEGSVLNLEPQLEFIAPLKPIAKDQFSGGMFGFTFFRNSKGSLEGFLIEAGRVKNIRFVKAD